MTLVYRIKVDLQNPDRELKPGMPADGKILLTSIPAQSNPKCYPFKQPT